MKKLITVAAILMIASGVSCADWPQYLGPSRNAVSPETGLARSWPEDGSNVLWTVPLGEGYSGAAVSNGKVYVLDRIVGQKDVLRCLDLDSGKEEWTFSYDAPGNLRHRGARTVPAIDGNYVYMCGPFGHLYCVDIQTHKAVWKKNVWKDFGGGDRLPMWALSQNPLIHGDSVIVAPQTQKVGVVALDKKTGDVQWSSPPIPGRNGYVSPTIVNISGDDHIVMISAGSVRPGIFRFRQGRGAGGSHHPQREGGRRDARSMDQRRWRPPAGGFARSQAKGAVVGIDPKTGKTLWSYEGWQCQTPVANVTAIGDGRLFITGAYRAGSAMIKVAKKGSEFVVTELYKTEEFGTHVHPAIYFKGHLYGHCTTNTGRADGMVCMDVDGNVKWKTGRSPVFDKGGFTLADGLILSVDGTKGILYLIEPNPQGFKALARADLLDTQKCWAPLALSDGKLLIRDQKQMKCVAVR